MKILIVDSNIWNKLYRLSNDSGISRDKILKYILRSQPVPWRKYYFNDETETREIDCSIDYDGSNSQALMAIEKFCNDRGSMTANGCSLRKEDIKAINDSFEKISLEVVIPQILRLELSDRGSIQRVMHSAAERAIVRYGSARKRVFMPPKRIHQPVTVTVKLHPAVHAKLSRISEIVKIPMSKLIRSEIREK